MAHFERAFHHHILDRLGAVFRHLRLVLAVFGIVVILGALHSFSTIPRYRANATLLGPITVGHDSVVGAQALVIRDVPADSRVLAPFSIPNLRSSRSVAKAARPRQSVVVAGQKHKGAAVFPSW